MSNRFTTWLSLPTATRVSLLRPYRAARSGSGRAQYTGNCASTDARDGCSALDRPASTPGRLYAPPATTAEAVAVDMDAVDVVVTDEDVEEEPGAVLGGFNAAAGISAISNPPRLYHRTLSCPTDMTPLVAATEKRYVQEEAVGVRVRVRAHGMGAGTG